MNTDFTRVILSEAKNLNHVMTLRSFAFGSG